MEFYVFFIEDDLLLTFLIVLFCYCCDSELFINYDKCYKFYSHNKFLLLLFVIFSLEI